MVRPAAFLPGFLRLLRSLSPYTFSLLALAACASAPVHPSASTINPGERDLFVEASEDIMEFHLKETGAGPLALNGLHRLTEIDPALLVERTADEVTLRYGSEIRHLAIPAPRHGAIAWGTISAEVLSAARAMSPIVGALPADRLDEVVIDASLAALDPYSRYVRPSVARERRAARDGFAGIGVTLDFQENDVRIASVMPDTPAAIAGLLAGDHIVMLDGVSVAKLDAEAIRRQLRGPAQTMVQLAVARAGLAEPMLIKVKRANIVPESVTLREAKGLAWLRLRSFNQQTAQSLGTLLARAHRDLGNRMRGIVLDLRDNPGGLLDQSVDVASFFLDGGDIISTTGRNPQSMQHFVAAERSGVETLPMVVLVNGGSASASEIVASALQDAGRAVVIGTSSYGKGTVQQVLRTANDGELTVTWAQIMTRQGYPLNTHGVVPTLCTSGVADNSANAAELLAGKPSPVPVSLASPRSTLDDAAWKNLRALCPPVRQENELDEAVATKLLTDPSLYRVVLASMTTARVATTH